MSFAKTLWASLAQSYSLPDRTAPMDETKTGRPEQSLEEQCTAHQQPGAPYVQHDSLELQQAPQLQQMEHSRGQVTPTLSYPQSTDQGRVCMMQFPTWYEGYQRYNNTYGFRYGVVYTAGQQTQHGFVQPSANLSPSWFPSNCISLIPTDYSGQAPSIHRVHGGDAYDHWQAQQIQQQQGQPQYGWQYQYTGKQTRYNHAEQLIAHRATPAHNSYLSPLGVPFDLSSSNLRENPTPASTGPGNEYRPVYTGPKSGSHKAFYGAYEPLDEDPGPEAHQSYETHTTTIDPKCTYLPYDSDEILVDQKPEAGVVRYSPKLSMPRARLHKQGTKNEKIRWDEQHGFENDVARERGDPNQTAQPYSTASMDAESQPRNTRPSPSFLAAFDDQRYHKYDQSSSSHGSLFGTYDYGRRQRQGQSIPEKLGFASEDLTPSEAMCPPAQTSCIPRRKYEKSVTSRRPRTPAQLLEHSVDAEGVLHTTAQKFHSKSPANTPHLCKEYLPVDQQEDSTDGVLLPVQNDHVLSRLSAKVEGSPWLADNQQRPKEQVDCHHRKIQAVHSQSVHHNLKDVHAPPVDSLESSARPRPTTELSEVYMKNTTPASTTLIHRRSMTRSSSLSPPSKRVKGQSMSSSKRADVTSGNEQENTTNKTKGGWGNFAAHIAQDDKNMVLKARGDQKRLGGETFRPELRETYKGPRGKETVVHDKVGSKLYENMATGSHVAEREKKEGNAGAVVEDRAYETDSSDGGIALSPLDVEVETDSWVAIKTGDENRGWERK